MAGAIKHMERSRRSHRQSQQYSIFNQFHRHAYGVAEIKKSRITHGQGFAGLSALLKRAMRQSTAEK